jgi:hypothetical protein
MELAHVRLRQSYNYNSAGTVVTSRYYNRWGEIHMDSFTLKQIKEILDLKYVPKERVSNYLITKGYDKEKEKYIWGLIDSFPRIQENDFKDAECVFNELLAMPCYSQWKCVCHEGKKIIKKVFYREGKRIISITFNLNDETDIVLYADFLKKRPEIINIVDFIETINKNKEYIDVFDGDVFSARDDWDENQDGSIYACNNGCYKRLLYTRGKGYMREGKPDYDKGEYNYHVLTLKKSFKKIGNIYADASFLVESDGQEE